MSQFLTTVTPVLDYRDSRLPTNETTDYGLPTTDYRSASGKITSCYMFETAIPIIRVSGSIAAQKFYCKGLGFTLLASWRPDETDPCYMTLVRDGARLHVHSFPSGTVGAGAVYVFVDNVD